MDQHRDVLTADGRGEASIHRQAEAAQLQGQLDELYKTMDRLQALQSEFTELIECSRRRLEDAHTFNRETHSPSF